ncbi:MAG: bacteriocin immunity protein [Lactobacillus sp.]|nr:bacteriocin immunity protein [Lactobacillus sp.]
MDEKSTKLFEAVSKAYSDKEVQADPELSDILFQAGKRLENNVDYKFVAIKLTQNIALYLISHEYKVPKSISELSSSMQKYGARYFGIASMMSWF